MKKLLYLLLPVVLILTAGCNLFKGGGNELPVAYIDSISPSSAIVGETVTFIGHGTDSDGTVVGYHWRSSIDGDIGSLASLDYSSLSEGNHTIYFKVQDNTGDWSEEVDGVVTVSSAVEEPAEEQADDGSFQSGQSDEGPSETIIPAELPYINYFTAEPAIISSGGSSTISWDVSNAESVIVTYGTSMEMVPPAGTATASPSSTTTYTLTATSGDSSVSATVTVAVEAGGTTAPAVDLPVINSFSASPTTIESGDSTTLSWNVSNADTLTLGGGPKTSTLSHLSASTDVSPSATITYTLTATNSSGSDTATVTVTVTAPAEQTTVLHLVLSESGSINSAHGVGSQLVAGDDASNRSIWAYFSFNTSALAGKEITKAELVYTPTSFHGHAWSDLVSLGIYQVDHGARPLQGSDFTFVGPTIKEGISQIQTLLPVDVTSQMQSIATAGEPRFQVRLNFVRMTDSDGQADDTGWTSADVKINVTYR
ncbi:MAG: hypothetical protein P8105_00945 [Dehalococcoidia bacterium]